MEERKIVKGDLEIGDARIIYKNFRGIGSQYNREGDRNFAVVLEDLDLIQRLSEDGWNVRMKAPREEGDIPFYYLPVAVKYEPYPPHIYLIEGRKKILLTEDSVGELDSMEIECVDIVINPYNWETKGGYGVKAYCKTMYVVVRTDSFAAKYDFTEPF